MFSRYLSHSFPNNITHSHCSDLRSKLPYSFANLTHILMSRSLSLSLYLSGSHFLSFSFFLTPTSHFLLASQGVMGSDNTAFAKEKKARQPPPQKQTEQSRNPAKQTIKSHMARLNSVKIGWTNRCNIYIRIDLHPTHTQSNKWHMCLAYVTYVYVRLET